jgi:hypothetical protein
MILQSGRADEPGEGNSGVETVTALGGRPGKIGGEFPKRIEPPRREVRQVFEAQGEVWLSPDFVVDTTDYTDERHVGGVVIFSCASIRFICAIRADHLELFHGLRSRLFPGKAEAKLRKIGLRRVAEPKGYLPFGLP